MDMPINAQLALAFHQIGVLKFGNFTLKSGKQSPFYTDLRLLVSHPAILRLTAEALAALITREAVAYDRLCALPYAALPIGTALALRTGRPLIYPRKERKAHGTGQLIEGEFQPGERVLLIDDVITTGDSKLEALAILQEAGLRVEASAVVIDRQSGGRELLAAQGVQVYAVLTLSEMLDTLQGAGKLEAETRAVIEAWLVENR